MGPTIAGYIDTPEGHAAATAAAEEATLRGTALVLASHLQMSGTGLPTPEETDRRHRLEASLERAVREVGARGLEVSHTVLQTPNDGGSALAHLCEEQDASLLVIGIRRRSRVGKLLLGSNAQKALMQAPCPVLCVRADED